MQELQPARRHYEERIPRLDEDSGEVAQQDLLEDWRLSFRRGQPRTACHFYDCSWYYTAPQLGPGATAKSVCQRNTQAVTEDAQIVSVRRDGRIFYGNTVIAVDELPDRIRESIKNGTDRIGSEGLCPCRCSRNARCGGIQRVLDEIRKTGVQNICFFAEKVSL